MLVASLLIVAAVCVGSPAVWGVPAVALGVVLTTLAPTVSPAGWMVFGAIVLAVPSAAGVAGALLDRVVRRGDHTDAPVFRVFLVVLAGGMVATTVDLPAALGAAVQVSRALERAGAFPVLARVVAAIWFCGGAVALVALGWLALIEVPIRWTLGVTRVRAFDLSIHAVRPFVVVVVIGSTLELVAGLWGHELSRAVLGG